MASSAELGAEKTLVLFKPDAVAHGIAGRVLTRFEDAALKVVGVKMKHLDADFTRKHYFDLGPRQGNGPAYGLHYPNRHARLFLRPHSLRRRGSNTEVLLRQYFPKGIDLSLRTQAELDEIAAELNGRPRKTLNRRKPRGVLNELMADVVCVALSSKMKAIV